MRISNRLVCLLFLFVVWCLLSGHFTPFRLSLGLVSCVLALAVYSRAVALARLDPLSFRPVAMLRYLAWLVLEVLKSNAEVIRAILTPERISPEFFDVSTGELGENARVVYANSITLTPGTVSTGINDRMIRVHALTRRSREGLLDDSMLNRVEALTSASNSGKRENG